MCIAEKAVEEVVQVLGAHAQWTVIDRIHTNCYGRSCAWVAMQEGEETRTEMRSFLLCGDRQLHDLHSKLRLEHPRGTADQLHK